MTDRGAFPAFCWATLRADGYVVTPHPIQGAGLMPAAEATKDGVRRHVEARDWRGATDRDPPVREVQSLCLLAASRSTGGQALVIVSSPVSQSLQDMAAGLGVELWGRERLHAVAKSLRLAAAAARS